MKKSDLIEDLAAAAEVTKPQARIMVDRLVELIQTGVRKAQDQGNQHCQVPCRAGPESRRQEIQRLNAPIRQRNVNKSRIPMRLFSLAFLMLQARDHVHPLGCCLLSQIAQIVEPVAQPW
jgi:hypothetical protein